MKAQVLWLVLLLSLTAGARPGLTAAEARALSQGRMSFREICRKPNDQVREQLNFVPSQFNLTDVRVENGNWTTQRQPGQARIQLPTTLQGKILQVQLDATFIQGEARIFTSNELAQVCEEILTFHVPAWSEGCDNAVSHRVRVMGARALTFNLPAHSKMRLRRLMVQSLD